MITASPLSRNQIKAFKLLKKRSERHAQQCFIVEGARAVQQIVSNGKIGVSLIIVDQNSSGIDRFMDDLQNEIPIGAVSSSDFRSLSDTDNAQGLMAVCHMPEPVSESDLLDGNGVILAVDRVQDPGNLGAMIRTAAWFGLRGMVMAPGTVDAYHPKVVRSTAGSTGALPVLVLNNELLSFLKQAGAVNWNVHLLDAGPEAVSYREMPRSGRDILVAGNEANGIAPELLEHRFNKIRIDPAENTGVESLNVSVASAIVISHFAQSGK